MNDSLKGVWKHMLQLGLVALAHSTRHSAYLNMENSTWYELSVLQAAHAAEILIKARIAQEHPLLIFESLPHSKRINGDQVEIEDLFKNGRTIQWSDLPERLFLTTGIYLPNKEVFNNFGRLRNGIQHFSSPPNNINVSEETLNFIYKVIDPFIYECWGLYAIDYDEDYNSYEYLPATLIMHEILFNVSPNVADCYRTWDIDWSKISKEYKDEIQSRIQNALKL